MLFEISSKKSLWIIGGALLLALFVLLGREQVIERTPLPNQWSVYFTNPDTNDLTFIIENNGPVMDFEWQIVQKNKVVFSEHTRVANKESIPLSTEKKIDDTLTKKVTLKIKDADGHIRELSKVFP